MIIYDEVIEAEPHSFGWLRVADHDEVMGGCGNDETYFEAWERPDGRIIKVPRIHPDQPRGWMMFVCHRGEQPVLVWPKGSRQI